MEMDGFHKAINCVFYLLQTINHNAAVQTIYVIWSALSGFPWPVVPDPIHISKQLCFFSPDSQVGYTH